MATSLPKAGLRPFLPADVPLLAEIFRASIAGLTEEDYSESQQEAWAATAADEAAFGRRLAGVLTLVATVAGAPVGFVALKGRETIDLLYVHPGAVRRGIATMLCEAIEQLAKARGAEAVTVDASDTAEPFFRRRGYAAQQRNTVPLGGEWLGTTTMRKPLAGATRLDA